MIAKLKIYADLDGVLADFDKAYAKIVGTDDKSKWPKDDPHGSFWFPIVRTKRFWLDIPKMPDADELWDFLRGHHHLTILSSPGTHDRDRAVVQKRLWVKANLGEDVAVILKPAKEKHHYACPNSLLIDDFPKNIKRWKEAGGLTIEHRTARETIGELKAMGVRR